MRSITANIGTKLLNNFVKEKYKAIKSNPYISYQGGPEKKYEIYCINNDENKVVLGYVNEYQVDDSTDSLATLFYNKNNAIQVYNLLDSLASCPYNSFPELMESNRFEIDQILYKIEQIKDKDETEFENDSRIYEELRQTYYFVNINSAYNDLHEKNNYLLDKYYYLNKNQAATLKKFDYILKKYQEMENDINEKKNKKSFFKKFYKKFLKK